MSEWKKVKLGELYEVHNGLSKPRSAFGSGYPFLSFTNVFKHFFLPKKLDSLVQSSESERDSFSIHRGDVFVTRTSETPEELGMSSVALQDYPNATYNGFCKRLRPNSNRVLPEFIGYALRDSGFRLKFYALAGSMTSRASLRNDDLLGMEVPLPPLPVQRRIAAVLSALDDKIELNTRMNANLEAQAQALFKSWFVDFEPWGGKMPEGWREGKLEDLGTVVGGGTPSKKVSEYFSVDGVAWLTPKDLSIRKDKFRQHGETDISEKGLSASGAQLLPKGTVLFSSRAPIGYIAIASGPVSTNQGFKSVIPKMPLGTAFVYYLLKHLLPEIENSASGSTFPEVSASMMRSVNSIVPDEKSIMSFGKTFLMP